MVESSPWPDCARVGPGPQCQRESLRQAASDCSSPLAHAREFSHRGGAARRFEPRWCPPTVGVDPAGLARTPSTHVSKHRSALALPPTRPARHATTAPSLGVGKRPPFASCLAANIRMSPTLARKPESGVASGRPSPRGPISHPPPERPAIRTEHDPGDPRSSASSTRTVAFVGSVKTKRPQSRLQSRLQPRP